MRKICSAKCIIFIFYFFKRAAESHSHRRRKGSQKVSQNSSLLMDGCVFVHVASSMEDIIHLGREEERESEREKRKTSSVKRALLQSHIQLASMLSPAGVVNDLIYEGSIHNPFPCHVLVHIINIKPSSTPQSLISPGLYTQRCQPRLPPTVLAAAAAAVPISHSTLSGSPLAPIQLHCTCLSLSHRPRLTCKVFLSHVAVMKRASHVEKEKKKQLLTSSSGIFHISFFPVESVILQSTFVCFPSFLPSGLFAFFFEEEEEFQQCHRFQL